jgi:hypothetical protein
MNRVKCPRCGGSATRIHRTKLERIFKPWRFGWRKMECDVCCSAFWVRAATQSATDERRS